MTAARYLCLGVPLLLTALAALAERDRRARAAALLAFLAAAVGVAALQEAARIWGWYAFAPVTGALRGLPVDLWLGWAALWGAVPVLLQRWLPVPLALGLLLWLDAVTMPALRPLVLLSPTWGVGEVAGLLLVALPAQLLGRWTAADRHLRARVALQLVVFTGAVLWLVPTAAFALGDGSWRHLTGLPEPALWLLAHAAALLALPALAAVREFATRGGGTPFPWDPPRRLVTTGPYAYLANPMQLSAVALVALLAATTRSLTLAGATVAVVAFSVAVAGPHERHDLAGRYGARWVAYRRAVRSWRPRWTPYAPAAPAVLWLDDGCGPCAAVGHFLAARGPRGLRLAAAAEHPAGLRRARYESGTPAGFPATGGYVADGVAAVAYGLEHVNLYWAHAGWLLRLPVIGWLAQLVTDALIAPPHAPSIVDREGSDARHQATTARRRGGRHP